MDFPITPQEITPEWLTGILRQSAGNDTASVTATNIELFAIGAGLTSRLARIRLQYDRSAPDLPQSLIGKFPHFDSERRKRYKSVRTLEGEVCFYQKVAPSIDMRTPQCYFSAYNESTYEFLILLEDLGTWRHLQDEPMTFEFVDALLEQLARLHARWWNNPSLLEMDWLPVNHYRNWLKIVPPRIPTFMDNYSHRVSADFAQVTERLLALLPALARRETAKPFTIMHGDYATTNMFARNVATGLEFAVVDWGLVMRGNGAFDVAYFLLRCLTIDDRQNWEAHLLERYHATLIEGGAEDYAFDDFIINYRWEILAGFIRCIAAASVVDPALSPDKAALYLEGYLPRYHAAYFDHYLSRLA